MRPRLDFLYLVGDWEIEKLGVDLNFNEEIKFLVKEIEHEYYKCELQKIGLEIKKCEAEENPALSGLVKKFQSISHKLYNLYEKEKNKKN